MNGLAVRRSRKTDDTLVPGLVHELRNAVSPLRYGVEVLRQQGTETPEGRRALDRLNRQACSLWGLLEGTLEFYRAERGKIVLQIQPVDLGAVVREAVEAVEPLVRERGHRLTVQIRPGATELDADPLRLGQVLTNLLLNAAKYTDPGGEIDVSALRRGEFVVIRVRDTGVGIAPDLLTRLFDPFVQSEPGRGGLGVGLALVRMLVELHGGSVCVESLGRSRGSTFLVHLPAARDAVFAAPAGAGLVGV